MYISIFILFFISVFRSNSHTHLLSDPSLKFGLLTHFLDLILSLKLSDFCVINSASAGIASGRSVRLKHLCFSSFS